MRGVAGVVVAGLVLLVPAPAQAATGWPENVANYATYVEYLDRVYADLLDRAPDPDGTRHWAGELILGSPVAAVADAITSSTEYRSHLIRQAYVDFLGRSPDGEGMGFWLGKLASGWTVAQIESGFIASSEYYAACGGTAPGWITALYNQVLARTPSPDEVGFWSGRIAAGATHREVALGFLLSSEHLSTVVNGYYQHLLGRGLDSAGKATWVGILQTGGRDERIIAGIVSSAEYWNNATAPTTPRLIAGRAFAPQTRAGEDGVPVLTLTYQDGPRQFETTVTSGVTYSVDGHPDACSGSRCRMTVAGTHALTAMYDGASYPGSWEVVPGQAATLTISPDDVSVTYWESVRFTVSGVDLYGNPYTGGDMVSDDGAMVVGQFSEGWRSTVAGDHQMTATVDGLTATATVHVAEPGPVGLRLYTWGTDYSGQLGLGGWIGDPAPHPTPTALGPDNRWLKASAGAGHVMAIRTDGTLWGWGANNIGQAGIADGLTHTVPMRIGTATDWVDVCASEDASYGLRADGTLWIWGATYASGGNPQLFVATPTRIDGGSDWASISCGGYSLLALKSDGSLWVRGELGGLIGDGSVDDWYAGSFHEAGGGKGPFTAVSLGATGYVLALRGDGTLWSWGSRDFGQLGVYTNVGLTQQPLQIGTDTWQHVDAGGGVSSAIRSDGTLWQWGAIGSPCTSSDTSACVTTPLQVGTGTTWRAVDTAKGNGVLLDSQGGLWAWGSNTYGQLGDGTTTDRTTPTRVGSATGWTSVDLGGGFAVALRP